MKKGILLFFVLFVQMAVASEMLLQLDFEDEVVGEKPARYDGLRPSADNSGQLAVLPVATGAEGPMGVIVGPYPEIPVTGMVGSGNYLRYYDHADSGAGGYELNFVNSASAGLDAIRFSFDVAASHPGVDSNTQLRVSVGQYFDQNKINLGSSARRPFLFDLRTQGTYQLSVMAEGGTVSGTYDLGSAHHVDLYVNDGQEETIIIGGPDGNARSLGPNTVTLYFDNVFVGQATLDNTLNYLLVGGNLGRIGFFSTTSDGGIDFILDNIEVEKIGGEVTSGGDTEAWKKEGTVIFGEDFEESSVGGIPTGERVRPSSAIGSREAYPIVEGSDGPMGLVIEPFSGSPVTNTVGTGNMLRLYDYSSGSGVSLERNFVSTGNEQISTFRASFKFGVSSALLNAESQLRFSLGEFSDSSSSSLGASSGRPFLLHMTNQGKLTLDMKDAEYDVGGSFDKAGEHEVVIYINDEEDRSHSVTGPDGVGHTLYTNSVMVFLDNVLIGVAPLDFELNYNLTEGNFGRFGFFTLSSQTGVDFLIDELVIAEIEQADSVLVPWPGSGGGDGVNEGPAPEDTSVDYDLVFLDERFDYPDGELGAVSFFTVADGEPLLRVNQSALIFDYGSDTGTLSGHYKNIFFGGNTVQTDTRAENAYGPAAYVRFRIHFNEAPSDGLVGVPFLALNNPDLDAFVTARVWIRAGSESGTTQLGVSPDGDVNHVVWVDSLLEVGDDVMVVLKYNNETNDTRIWIDPATANEEPDGVTFKKGDVGYYGVNALSMLMNNTEDYGAFELDDVRVAGSFDSVLDFEPIERPEVLLTSGTGGIYTAESIQYRALVSGNMDIDSLLVGGEPFLLNDLGAGWVATETGSLGNSRQYGGAHLHIQTNWQLSTASFSQNQFTLNLQNNDENHSAIYRFVFDARFVKSAVDMDGGIEPLPLSTRLLLSEIALKSDYNVLHLRGVNEVYMDGGNLIVDIQLDPRETRSVSLHFGTRVLYSPANWQVFQRASELKGAVVVRGRVFDGTDTIRILFEGGNPISGNLPAAQEISVDSRGEFDAAIDVPAGGWYQMDLDYIANSAVVGEATIAHVGVGELFVGAGQSNSTNSGSEATTPVSDLVVSYSGGHWQPGVDPQPGNHDTSSKGSYYPALGDLLAAKYGVPIAFASTGMGASAIRFWQPDYTYDYTDYVSYARHNGLYGWTLNRIKQLGPNGFRAVLWHQGESDSSHVKGVTRTTENEYYNGLKRLIETMRGDAGWNIPWYVAQASVWPLPEENPMGDENIANAQMRIWSDKIAYEGANTDSLGLEYRQPDGSRVHFTPFGLSAHGALWFDLLSAGIDAEFETNEDPTTRQMKAVFGTDIIDGGDSWYQASRYEWISAKAYPWCYSNGFGWFYVRGAGTGVQQLYSISKLGNGSWLYINQSWLPYIYSYKEANWLYLIRTNEGNQVYRYATDSFDPLP